MRPSRRRGKAKGLKSGVRYNRFLPQLRNQFRAHRHGLSRLRCAGARSPCGTFAEEFWRDHRHDQVALARTLGGDHLLELLVLGAPVEAVELDVTGMECVNCASSIKTYLEKLNGIHNVDINFTSEVANVAYNPNVILIKDIVADIRKLGYDVIEADDEEIVENIKKQSLNPRNIILSFRLF